MINFDNILYTPLDIPLLPFSNRSQIVDLYQTHATNIEKPTDPNLPVFWKGITCYKGPSFTPEMLLHVGTFIDMADLDLFIFGIYGKHLPKVNSSNYSILPKLLREKIESKDFEEEIKHLLTNEFLIEKELKARLWSSK
jgi:hypothetical protein